MLVIKIIFYTEYSTGNRLFSLIKNPREEDRKLLQKKIVLFNPIVTYIQDLKNKENLKVLLLLSVFLCLIISPRATATSSWEITPENPVVGDIMEIKGTGFTEGTGFTGENAEIMVTFEKEVQVIDGSYEYTLENVVIPGANNSYIVQATGSDDLNVRAEKHSCGQLNPQRQKMVLLLYPKKEFLQEHILLE